MYNQRHSWHHAGMYLCLDSTVQTSNRRGHVYTWILTIFPFFKAEAMEF